MDYKPLKPVLEHLCTLYIKMGDLITVGQVPLGERRVVPLIGGTFEGKGFKGEVLPGADWQYIAQPSGSAMVDAKYLLKTDDGVLITVHNHGWRCYPPELLARLASGEDVDTTGYYFKATPEFEVPPSKYSWLNEVISVCSGTRGKNSVILDFYVVR